MLDFCKPIKDSWNEKKDHPSKKIFSIYILNLKLKLVVITFKNKLNLMFNLIFTLNQSFKLK